jgi:ribosomal protein S18 acetylase RimI-like enzyme
MPGSADIVIRPYRNEDHTAVRALFIAVNRALAPPDQHEAFERYIAQSLTEEIDRIEDYYGEHAGCFMVATRDGLLAGTFGLEAAGEAIAELRRMYVDPDQRRMGIARAMLRHAEDLARTRGNTRLVLSTSELQKAALALYRASGFTETRQEVAQALSNKTVGGGIRRFHFEKWL